MRIRSYHPYLKKITPTNLGFTMKKVLKIAAYAVGAVVLLIAIISVWATYRWDASDGRPVKDVKAPSDPATLERGRFLYTNSLTCWECHGDAMDVTVSPKGGVKFDLNGGDPKLGVWYSKNITPDAETGIGNWTDGEIVRALREGVRKDGTPLFPIMPMEQLHGLSDSDALAVTAFLRTLPSVRNEVPPNEPTFFVKVLFTLGAIGPKPEIEKEIVAPAAGPTALYGRYIAMSASLCGDCHTPRNMSDGSFYKDSLFAGSSFAFGDPEGLAIAAYASNITPDMATGIGSWSEEAFLRFMRTGEGPDGTVRLGHMPYAATSRWPEDYLKAVYAFLRTVRPVERPKFPRIMRGDAVSTEPAAIGKTMYEFYCGRCHGPQGQGGLATDLALAEVAPTLKDEEFVEFIRKGMDGTNMPGFDKTLNDDQIKAVVAHVRGWERK